MGTQDTTKNILGKDNPTKGILNKEVPMKKYFPKDILLKEIHAKECSRQDLPKEFPAKNIRASPILRRSECSYAYYLLRLLLSHNVVPNPITIVNDALHYREGQNEKNKLFFFVIKETQNRISTHVL